MLADAALSVIVPVCVSATDPLNDQGVPPVAESVVEPDKVTEVAVDATLILPLVFVSEIDCPPSLNEPDTIDRAEARLSVKASCNV